MTWLLLVMIPLTFTGLILVLMVNPAGSPRRGTKCCQRSVRQVDLIGRCGGEEVVIFLPEADSDTALQVAERVRESVEKLSIKMSDQELHITVSIGVSRRDENTAELETLIARADQAMYVAKYKGRNRVAMST